MDAQSRTEGKINVLQQREYERQSMIQHRKADQQLGDARNESSEFFQQNFNDKRKEIQHLILSSPGVPKEKLLIHFDNISKQILLLQKYIASSTLFLRTYDLKVYQNNIRELNMQLKDTEAHLVPKKRFGFKASKANGGVSEIDGSLGGKSASSEKISASNCKSNINEVSSCGFRNEIGKHLSLTGDEVHKKDVTLCDLNHCIVKVQGAPSTLHMSNIRNCQIYCGPVSTSIFADNCEDCSFAICCQQLRLHTSQRIDIYLHVTSRAIMEDCTGVLVGPYNYYYSGIEGDFQAAGIDKRINNWHCIDDFNWLNSESKSPHWAIMPTSAAQSPS